MIWSQNFASVVSPAYHSRHNSQEKAKTHAHALGQNRARGKQGALWAILLSPGAVLLGGDVPPRSPNSDLISDQKNVNFHTRFQTWRRSQNVTICMLTSHKTEIMSPLLRLERQQKDSENPFRIRILDFRSYSLGIETTNTSIHTVVPS